MKRLSGVLLVAGTALACLVPGARAEGKESSGAASKSADPKVLQLAGLVAASFQPGISLPAFGVGFFPLSSLVSSPPLAQPNIAPGGIRYIRCVRHVTIKAGRWQSTGIRLKEGESYSISSDAPHLKARVGNSSIQLGRGDARSSQAGELLVWVSEVPQSDRVASTGETTFTVTVVYYVAF